MVRRKALSARRGAGAAAARNKRRSWHRFPVRRTHAVLALGSVVLVALPFAHRPESNREIDLAAAKKAQAALPTIAESSGGGADTEIENAHPERFRDDTADGNMLGEQNKQSAESDRQASRAERTVGVPSDRLEERPRAGNSDTEKNLDNPRVKTKSRRPNRFPRYSSPEFSEQCGWILNAAERCPPSNCTFFHGPSKSNNEGISWWSAQIVSSHLLAMQCGCRILFDYGPQVDIHEVLVPYPGLGSAESEQLHNWTLPLGFKCEQDDHCHQLPEVKGPQIVELGNTLDFEMPGRGSLAKVPRYRYAYSHARFKLKDHISDDLELALPGFNLETGMACSLGTLFHLAPNASQFEPGLHKMLSILHDEDALVMGLYIRTGWADWSREEGLLYHKRKGNVMANNSLTTKGEKNLRNKAHDVLHYAIEIEQSHLLGWMDPHREFSKIVWMVSTDSPHIKKWIVNGNDGKNANAFAPQKDEKRRQRKVKKYGSRVIPRTVLTTGSRGKHTRFSDKPSTDVFAEGLIDWFLLGETDLVISSHYTFAETAAMRTARPVYKGGKLVPLILDK